MKVGININNKTLNNYYKTSNVNDNLKKNFLKDITNNENFNYEYFDNDNTTLYLFDDKQVNVDELSYIINSTIMKIYMNKKRIVVNNLKQIEMLLKKWKEYKNGHN